MAYEQDGWKIDFKVWKRKRIQAFMKEIEQHGAIGDGVIPFYQEIIQAWPYPCNPSDASSYDVIDVPQLIEVQGRVLEAVKSLQSGAGKAGVPGQ